MTLHDVVITGVGAVTPLGVGARELHERWTAGACGIRDGGAPCADFTVTDHMTSKEARRADRSTQFAIAAGDEAVADAGWADELPYDAELIGCVPGTGIGGIETIENNHDTLRDTGPGAVSPLAVPLMMSNAGSAALSLRHGLRGPVFSVASACAAASHAIGTALRMIQHGEAEAVVTGGGETLALGERAEQIPVSSTKAATGHLLGAAGAVEAIATTLALRDRIAPPTIGWAEPDEGLDLDYVPGTARPLALPDDRPPVALSNSFGSGGHNATLCLQAA
ncbi:MAG: 3-oxoacyl-[acyl-carrier-protein] synthase [Solirubrobacteraceae bacterium]|nr:3-oxoacyl-[acyl-carrier-protein] synthase [Solirubrobacteraceae bacterium]